MILNLSNNDYANYSHDNARALRSIGLECIDLARNPHVFDYSSQSTEADKSEIVNHIKKADVIQVMHSNTSLFHLAKTHNPEAKIIIYHTGTIYRNNNIGLERTFKGYKTVTDQTEFMSLGNHEYIVSPVKYKLRGLCPTGTRRVGHYPSVASIKGTTKILEMLENVEQEYLLKCDTRKVTHKEQINRLARTDIYIELFKPELNGKAYGCFGVTALEAAAMGKIVITQNLFENVYKDAYGHCPLTIANTEDAFMNTIDGLLTMNRRDFRQLQKDTFQIMKENHSYKSTGERIAKFIL